jgi:hypothetical protein
MFKKTLVSLSSIFFLNSFSHAQTDTNQPKSLVLQQSSVPSDWVHSSELVPLNALHSDLKYEIASAASSTIVPSKYITRVSTFHDRNALYVEINAIDPTPDKIIAANGVHDTVTVGDKVQLFVDPLGTGRRAYVFTVSASGSTGDQIISSVGEASPNWNGQWESSTKRTSTGYTVRYRIPFQTIEVQENSKDIAINVNRSIGYGQREVLSWAPVDVHLSCEVCQFEHFKLDDLQAQESQLLLSPYIVSRYIQQTGKSTTKETYTGLDMQWSKNGNKIIGTIRPDYLQLDFDSFQITTNRRYAINLTENRPFFTQDRGPFNTEMSLIYTRAITDLDWGVQYVGRQADQTFGVIVAKDRYTNIVRPEILGSSLSSQESGSTNAIVSYGLQLNDKLRLGTLATVRFGDNYQNTMISGSLGWSPSAENSFTVVTAYSQTRDPIQATVPNGSAFYLNHTYSDKTLFSQSSITYVAENFRADMGYMNLAGGTRFSNYESLNFDQSENDFITSYGGYVTFDTTIDADNNLVSYDQTLSASITMKSQYIFSISKQKNMYIFDTKRFLSDQTTINFDATPFNCFTIMSSFGRGTTTDFNVLEQRPLSSMMFTTVWQITSQWKTSTSIINEKDADSNDLGYKARVVNVKLSYSPSKFHTLKLQLAQSSTLQKDLFDGILYEQHSVSQKEQIVYTWNPQIGTTLVLGWQGNRTKTDGKISTQTTAVFGKFVKVF